MSVLELFKTAAAPLKGKLYLSQSGWLLMSVPNAIGRGAFDALNEPGTELPMSESELRYNAHVSVMRPEEIESFGGPDKITERGHEFGYSLGKIKDFNPAGWEEMNRCWVFEVKSPELKKLRQTYGLTPLPVHPKTDKAMEFHVTFAVRKSGVLGANETSKANGTNGARKAQKAQLPWDKPGVQSLKVAADKCPGCGRKFKKDEPYPDVTMCEICERYGKPKEAADTVTLGQSIARAARKAAQPSPAQAEAGNYRKGHVRMHGLDISIETKKGDKRDPAWPALQHHYGYIRRTTDADGDSVDVFLGGSPDTELAFVVDQIDPETKRFDEHKVMLGFSSLREAKDAYLANYEKGWKGLGKITPLTMQQFKEWLKDGSQTRPVSTQTFKMKKAAAEKQDDSDDAPGILVLQRSTTIRFVPPEVKNEDEREETLKSMEDEFEKLLEQFDLKEEANGKVHSA